MESRLVVWRSNDDGGESSFLESGDEGIVDSILYVDSGGGGADLGLQARGEETRVSRGARRERKRKVC